MLYANIELQQMTLNLRELRCILPFCSQASESISFLELEVDYLYIGLAPMDCLYKNITSFYELVDPGMRV
jgi:hypothetical protein